MHLIDIIDAAIYLLPVVAGLFVLSGFSLRMIRRAV